MNIATKIKILLKNQPTSPLVKDHLIFYNGFWPQMVGGRKNGMYRCVHEQYKNNKFNRVIFLTKEFHLAFFNFEII